MIKRIALLTLLVTPLWLSAQVRTEKLLEKGWKFTREDNPEFKTSQFDDTKWQSVCIPHDWAIYGLPCSSTASGYAHFLERLT